MDWKNRLTKTPYLVLFVILIAIGGSTAYALMTITLAGNVIIEGDTQMDGNLNLDGAHSGIIWNSRVPSNPTINTVDSADNVGQHTSITLGADGLPIISYYKALTGDLKVAKCHDPACADATITTVDFSGDVGRYSSIAIGTDGNPVISYWQSTTDDLKFAKCDNPACTSSTIETVDSTDDVGSHTSTIIAPDGNPLISYYSQTGGSLKLAYCDDAACSSASTIKTIDTTDDVGTHSSLALKIDSNPIISYYDNTNDQLKIASCMSFACAGLTKLNTGVSQGKFTSITIGSDNIPFVVHSNLNTVFITYCNNSSCQTLGDTNTLTTLDNADGLSVTVGADGYPIASVYNDETTSLWVIKCYDLSCDTKREYKIDGLTDNVGKFSSIVLGSDGIPIVSYRDVSNSDLKVSQCGNPFCAPNWTRR